MGEEPTSTLELPNADRKVSESEKADALSSKMPQVQPLNLEFIPHHQPSGTMPYDFYQPDLDRRLHSPSPKRA